MISDNKKAELILKEYHEKLHSNIDENLRDVTDCTILESEDHYYNMHFSRYLKMLDILESTDIKFDNFLDIGPSFSHFAYLISKFFNADGFTVDVENEAHKQVSKILEQSGFQCKFANVVEKGIPYKDNKFQLVIFSEVIEHIPASPTTIFKEISRVIKKDGFLFLTTPNAVKLFYRLAFLRGRNPYPLFEEHLSFENAYIRHWREYTLTECIDFLEKNGFTQYKSGYVDFQPAKPRNPVKELIMRILLSVHPPFRDSFWIVARKI